MSHYATLDIPRDATAAQIKAAFRKLASEHHPDRGGDTGKAAAINDAYAVLSDQERRARYDAGLDDALPPSPEELARQSAMKILGAVIDGVLADPEIEHTGLVRSVRQELNNAADKFKFDAAGHRKAAARLERIRARVVRKAAAGGDDLVAMILGGKIAALQRREAETLKAVDDVRGAIAMLEGYENEADTSPQIAPRARNATQSQADLIAQMMKTQFGGFKF
jgi:curved DNA-binding protein CbpA